MKKHICILTIVILVLSFVLIGCSSEDEYLEEDIEFIEEDMENGEDEELLEEAEASEEQNLFGGAIDKSQSNAAATLKLEEYQLPGIFKMQKPKGWQVYKAGEYNTLAYITRDENEPLRQVFFFSEIGLFYVDEAQKSLEINYQNNGGYPVQWIDMPVVSPYDGKNFFLKFDEIMESKIAKGFRAAGSMPKPSGFANIEIISQEELAPIIPGVPAVLVRALLTKNGRVAQGMFVVSAVSDGQGHATALMVTGISAPINEYSTAQNTLLEVVRSFTLDDSYVKEGVNAIQQNGERLMEISKTLSETSDIITKGWAARNKSDDVRMAKKADQIMGVERVYDPDKDEVYEVNNGFFDYYQTHQEEYKQKNLQQLPDKAYDLWDKAPMLNHGLTSP